MIGPLLGVLPPHSSKKWMFAFEIAAAHPLLGSESIHGLLLRAVKELKIVDRKVDPATKRWVYARARAR